MALTKDDIWVVADRLDAEGKAPTLAAVRKALGSGSFTTISEAMREWHQRKKDKVEQAKEAGPVPPALDDAIRRFAQDVWAKATELATAEALRLSEEFAQAKKQWDRERQELEAVADDLSSALEEEQTRVQACEEARAEMAKNLAEMNAERLALRQQLAQYEARMDELRSENARLHALLQQAIDREKKSS